MAKSKMEPRDLRGTSKPIEGDRTARYTADTSRQARTTRNGAVAAEPRRGGRRRGLLWGLLALLAAAIIAAIALGLFSGDDNGGRAGGSLSAGGTAILPPPSGGLGKVVGQQASGKGAVVQSVVHKAAANDTPEGFWVGTSAKDRVYVEWGGTVGGNEATHTPAVGDKVDLSGPVRPAPQDPQQTLKLSAADAQLVKSEGGYVNADKVSPAKD
jgi:hypothetical protein